MCFKCVKSMGHCTKTLRQENVVFVLDVSGSMQVRVPHLLSPGCFKGTVQVTSWGVFLCRFPLVFLLESWERSTWKMWNLQWTWRWCSSHLGFRVVRVRVWLVWLRYAVVSLVWFGSDGCLPEVHPWRRLHSVYVSFPVTSHRLSEIQHYEKVVHTLFSQSPYKPHSFNRIS